MFGSEGGPCDSIGSLYIEMGQLKEVQYILPNGNIGRRFVDGIADEIEKANQGL